MIRFTTKLQPNSPLIDMTPFVDVVFLLLIFFIITSDILPFKSLPVQLATLPADSTPLTSQLVVIVDRDEVIYVGSKKLMVELEQLTSQLLQELEKHVKQHMSPWPTIVLAIDQQVTYATFLQIFHAAQQTGATLRLAYHTEVTETLDVLLN